MFVAGGRGRGETELKRIRKETMRPTHTLLLILHQQQLHVDY